MGAYTGPTTFSNQVKQTIQKSNYITSVHYIYLCIIYSVYDLIRLREKPLKRCLLY